MNRIFSILFRPSHCAISKGNLDCLKSIIKFRGNIWIKNQRGDYPIHETINTLSSNKIHNQTNEYSQISGREKKIFF